jgi:quinone-modifying oxidoreductase subunit QmoB
MMEAKIGICLCSGCAIGQAVDVTKLKSLAEGDLKVQSYLEDSLVCGDECIKKIQSEIKERELNRMVIAACSGRYFVNRFNFGPDVLVDRVPLRELVAWSHAPAEEETQSLAEDYLRMAVVRMQFSESPAPHIEDISRDILVLGGGVAGMSAALAAADAGYNTVLVEKEKELGGWSRRFLKVTPQDAPYHELAEPPHNELAAAIKKHSNIKLHTGTTIEQTTGQPGQFTVNLRNGNGGATVKVGAIVQATGWKPYDAKKLDKYGFGKFSNVVTNIQFEEMAQSGKITRPSDGKAPKSVAIIHCAGSRDKDHLMYCSAVCCRAALKHALYIRKMLPETDVYLLYKDIRAPGLYEQFYATVQETGVFMTRGEVSDVAGDSDGGVIVTLDETLLGERIAVKTDLLVLATGMVPSTYVDVDADADAGTSAPAAEEAKDTKKEGASAEKGAKILNLTYRLGTDLPTLKYGFPDSHFICFPYETRRTGIYAAGTVRAPMDIRTACSDGMGAALKAIQSVEAISEGRAVHPRSGDVSIPEFFMQRCTQCKRCTEECPFGSLDEDVKGTPLPNLLRCRRCGICMGACPERIISFKDYSPTMISQMIKAIPIPEEDEEKPRILAFICENDAIPALDIAALHRKLIDPTVRVIPVRCIGSVNTVFIADALSAGFDGILLIGCQRGDDYQCHFIRGSELANKRMENVQEKLKQLVLEPERVQIEQAELSDWERIPKIINDFAGEIRSMGMNPYKGF